MFTGRHDGTDFVLAEARLFNRSTRTSGSGTKRTTTTRGSTVFKGLLFLIATPHAIPARILLRGPRIPWFCEWRPGASALQRLGEDAHALMDEVMVVHRLIDVLKGR